MENNIEQLEEKVEVKKKGNKGLVVLVILLLLICCGLGAFIFMNKDKIFEKEKEIKEEKEVKKDLEISEAIKEKLERFVIIATHFDSGNTNNTLNHFIGGTSSIPKEVKLKMTRNAVYEFGKIVRDFTLSDNEVISRLEGTKPDNGEIVDILKKENFDKIYKQLFGEDAKYEFEELKGIGCPAPMAIDPKTNEMYLFHRCGGTGVLSYDMNVVSYDSDDENYYVEEKIVEENLATKETKTTVLLWSFDKDFKFVKVEKKQN